MMLGALPALAAAVGFGLFQVVNRRALHDVDVYRGMLLLLGTGALTLAILGVATGRFLVLVGAPIFSVVMAAMAGFVHFFLGWTFMSISRTRLGGARTAALIATMPLFGALVATGLLGEPLTALHLIGVLVVVGGGAIVAFSRARTTPVGTTSVAGVAAGLATALCWGISPVFVYAALDGIGSPMMVAMIGTGAAAIVYGVGGAATSESSKATTVDRRTWGLRVLAGVLLAIAIWMMWTAFDLTLVVVVLAILQLASAVVLITVGLITHDRPVGSPARLWTGVAAIVAGSILLVALT